MLDRQPGAGAGDQLRQRRRGLARLFGAVGRAGRAAQGDQVAADAPQPAGHQADARPGDVALGRCDAAQLHRMRATSINKGRMVRLAEYSRDCLQRAARRHRHPLRRARAGHAAAVPHAEAARRHGQGHRDPRGLRRALPAARPRRLRAVRAGAGRGARQVRRRPAAAGRRDRRLLQVHAGARAAGAGRGRALSLRRRRSSDIARDATGVTGGRTPTPAPFQADALRGGAGQLFAAAAAAAGHPPAGLSGQGLLDHGADHRRGDGARVDGDGRDLQGRRHPAGRPHPRRRHGAARRATTCAATSAGATRWSTSVTDLFPQRRRRRAAPSSGPACGR